MMLAIVMMAMVVMIMRVAVICNFGDNVGANIMRCEEGRNSYWHAWNVLVTQQIALVV